MARNRRYFWKLVRDRGNDLGGRLGFICRRETVVAVGVYYNGSRRANCSHLILSGTPLECGAEVPGVRDIDRKGRVYLRKRRKTISVKVVKPWSIADSFIAKLKADTARNSAGKYLVS
jgi:hypothetical protein